jgi:hypothetical protein
MRQCVWFQDALPNWHELYRISILQSLKAACNSLVENHGNLRLDWSLTGNDEDNHGRFLYPRQAFRPLGAVRSDRITTIQISSLSTITLLCLLLCWEILNSSSLSRTMWVGGVRRQPQSRQFVTLVEAKASALECVDVLIHFSSSWIE